jgi:hypothetical protein
MATKKQTEDRVSRLFHQNCTGIQIPMMKLPALMKLGVEAVEAGKTDKEIGDLLYQNAVAFGKENGK